MNFKKCFIILLIFALFLSVSDISAVEDVNPDYNDTSEILTVGEEDNLDATDNEILSDGEHTFSDLNNTISSASEGSTINLENNFEYSDVEDNTITAGIEINKKLVINGKGHILNANGNTNFFNIKADYVTLKNIIFVNGKSTSGSAILLNDYSNLIIDNCTFINNNGGAAPVYLVYGNNVIIKNCMFINNSGASGGIYWQYYGGKIDKCIFINNSGSQSGAIYWSVYWKDGNISNSIFLNNTGNYDIYYNNQYVSSYNNNLYADNNWWGHTIDNYDKFAPKVNSALTVNNYHILDLNIIDTTVTVSLNKIYEEGKLINQNYALPNIDIKVKSENITVPETVNLNSNGESTFSFTPVDEYSVTLIYNNVILIKEIAPNNFNALNQIITDADNQIDLNIDYSYDLIKDDGIINGIEINKDLTIDGQGHTIDAKGASNIFYFNDESLTKTLILKNIIFTNAVGENGAAVYFKGKHIEIINCTFINNTAGEGDAVYVADALDDNRITQSLFINNKGSISVAYINSESSNAKLVFDNSIFLENKAINSIKGTSNVVADYNWFGNTKENYNSNIHNCDGVTINKWLFLKIDSDVDSGIAKVSLNNVFDGETNNTFDGYALKPLTLNIQGSDVVTNMSTVNLNDNGEATFKFKMMKLEASLITNYGDISTYDNLQYIIVDDGSFKALNDILWFAEGDIDLNKNYTFIEGLDTITTGLIIKDSITVNGNGYTIDAKEKAAILKIQADNVVLKNINFINGKSNFGGAIYFNTESLTIDNCTFINNTAKNGGAIYSYAYSDMGTITNSKFINNTGTNGASVIYNYADALNMEKCIIINNTGMYTIYQQYARGSITNSLILNNIVSSADIGTSGSFKSDNNWFGNTFDDRISKPNVYLGISNWLYLDIDFKETYAIISLNKIATQYSAPNGVYENYNLPEITLNINSTTLNLLGTDKVTLDSTGKAIVPYEMNDETAALTVSYQGISLTKDRIIGDFDRLQDLIEGSDENSVIELDRNYAFNEVDTLTEGIVINKNITIDGKGFTIDAKDKARIFNIQALGVTFKNLIFTNGNSDHGSAICFENDNTEKINFEVYNCTFVNNTANNQLGQFDGNGAIYIKTNDGSYKIIDSKFENNKATPLGNIYSKGGAIYLGVKNSEVTIYNSSFISNSAYNGGALYVQADNSQTNIDKSLFRNNNYYGTASNRATTIFWKTTNDNGNNMVKNSIFLDNRGSSLDNHATFVLNSGNVNIDNNWWGNTEKNYNKFGQSGVNYTFGITPNSWLFLNASVSSYMVSYNETSTINYLLNSYDGETISDFDDSKLPHVEFNVECDKGQLSKDSVSLDDEFIYKATDLGNPTIFIPINNIPYEISLKGPGIMPIVDEPFVIYAEQGVSKKTLIKTANNRYNAVTISCNDTDLINLNGNYDITAYTKEGTVKLTFTSPELTDYASNSCELLVKVVKVPLLINVTNIESKEITLNVGDELDLDIAFIVDEIHKNYAPAWNTLGFECNSSIISFTYENGERPNNASFYPTGHIIARGGGTTNLTIYSTSQKFKYENYTIKITVKRIPTEITLSHDDNLSLKVDETSKVNATLNATGTLRYYSDNSSIVIVDSNGNLLAQSNGTSVITVSYTGNSTHEKSSKTVKVTVTKYDTTTEVTSNKDISLKIDDESQITATATAVDGKILTGFSYESSNPEVASVDDAGKIIARGEGQAVITVRYDGDRKYANSSDTIMVNVSKLDSIITINSENPFEINVLSESQIDAILNHEGTLTYTSSNSDIAVVDDNGKISAFKGGKVNITISFGGDDKYGATEVNLTVIVNKLPVEITVNPTISVDVGSTVAIQATATNYPIIFINNNDEIISLENNKVTGLIGGKANVTVKIAEDDCYLGKEVNVTVTVNKLASTISLNPIEINVSESKLINPTITGDGIISYVSSNPEILTVNATTGNITGVKGGKANITIKMAESDRYNATEFNVTVTVNKLVSIITVENTDLSVDVDGNVEIIATSNNDGILTFTSLNTTVATVSGNTVIGIIGGKANITLSVEENERYLANSITVTVTVNKLATIITADEITIKVGENKTILYSTNSEGSVTVTSLNPAIVSVLDSNVTGIIGGKANVTISVDETDKYLANSTNVTVTVNKLSAPVSADDITIKVNDDQTITYTTDSDGEVTFTSQDSSIASIEGNIVKGVAGGEVNITINVAESDKYLANSTNITITVNKLKAIIEIEEINLVVDVNGNVEIKATANSDAELTFTSLNTDIATVSGNTVTGIIGGKVNITVTSPESDKYLANSTNVTVTVNKLPTIITVNESFTLNVDDETDLNALLNHEGDLNYIVVNSSIVSVDSTGKVKAIAVGTNNVNITFEENDKYLSSNKTVTVTVNKIPISENPVSIVVNDNGTASITVTLPQNATGNVTVDVDGSKTQVSVENGTAKTTVNNLKPGDTQITVSYDGDEKHEGFTRNITAHVPIAKLAENNDVIKLYLDKKTYNVKLTKDDKPVAGEVVKIIINGVTYDIKTNNNGIAVLKINLIPGTYDVTAEYNGVKVTDKVTVKHVIKIKNIKVKKSAKKLKIKVTLKKVDGKYLKGKKITLKFRGKTYTAKTNNKGVATFKINKKVIKKLKVGKKYKYRVKYVDESLKKTVKCVK